MNASYLLGLSWKIGIPGACIAGGYALYDQFYPKNYLDWLEHEKLKLPDTPQSFQILFADFFEELRENNIVTNVNSLSDIEEGFGQLKVWCNHKKWKKYSGELFDDYNRFVKYCVIRNFHLPKNVASSLVKRDKIDVVKGITDDEYKTVFAVYKYMDGFTKALNDDGFSVSVTTDNETGQRHLRDWCVKKMKEEPNFQKISLVASYCSSPGFITVEEKFTADGFKKVTDETKWPKKFNKKKSTSPTLMELMNRDVEKSNKLTASTDDAEGGNRFRAWCEEAFPKKLADPGVYQDFYVQVRFSCHDEEFNVGIVV